MISLILNGRAMKKLFGLFAALALVCASCSKYDDSALKNRLDALDERIEVLNQRLQALNENVSALGVLAQAYAAGSYVTGITEVRDQDGNLTGYKVSFTNLEPVTIHTGQDGADGYIGSITQEIQQAIGDTTDAYEACARNVRYNAKKIQEAFVAHHELKEHVVVGAVYDIASGRVEWLF